MTGAGMSGATLQCLASVPRGFGDLLALELVGFGAQDVRERGNQVAFTGTLEVAYRACLESRVASRVYVEVARIDAPDEAGLYRAMREIDWAAHVDPAATLACDWSGRHPAISNTHFGALRLKDAICDALRDREGSRPDVSTERPGVRVHAHARETRVTLSIDLAGEGLHRRGYRADAGEAPLRENVAAGVLLRAGWPALAASGAPLVDPMCGSGTFVIEAALIAADVAPNLWREYFGLLRWRGHDPQLWQRLREAASARATAGLAAATARASEAGECLLRGSDRDRRALAAARSNAARAGVTALVEFAEASLEDAQPGGRAGLVCTNPPYGVRLGADADARETHRLLGRVLTERFAGWQAAVLTGAPDLGLELGLRAQRVHTVWNGALEGRLLRIQVEAAAVRELRPTPGLRIDASLADSPGARMVGNRLTKNLKRLRSWAAREQVGCYRIYDADMPEYSFAIDLYTAADGERRWLYVQEYAAPREIPEEDVRRRRSELLAALGPVTGVPATDIHLRTRRRSSGGEQYAKVDDAGEFQVVLEQGLKFRVNFDDYLDTGLFLDHRITRARLRAAAARARFLNLFAYTGSATVYAAAGGARSTVTVDLSRTYLDWAQRNLALNGLDGPQHERIQADARVWLEEARRARRQFDLIFLDPPTFSNSKRMEGVLDTQRDHAALIDACMALLAPTGLLVFSTNAQRFKLDPALAERHELRDISRATLPPDFERNARIHQCFELRHRAAVPAP
jgi:23S rRNA (guanine2445-N2)-methyltransferase / 23S rRNA (guanine2069-N7)-methyltransferase